MNAVSDDQAGGSFSVSIAGRHLGFETTLATGLTLIAVIAVAALALHHASDKEGG